MSVSSRINRIEEKLRILGSLRPQYKMSLDEIEDHRRTTAFMCADFEKDIVRCEDFRQIILAKNRSAKEFDEYYLQELSKDQRIDFIFEILYADVLPDDYAFKYIRKVS